MWVPRLSVSLVGRIGDSTVARAGFHSSISRPAHLRAVGPIGMPELDVSRCERHLPHRLVAINFTTFKVVAKSRGFGFLQAARVEQHRGGELQAPGARTARSAPRPAAPRASPRERRASPGPRRAGVTVPRPAAPTGAQGQYCPQCHSESEARPPAVPRPGAAQGASSTMVRSHEVRSAPCPALFYLLSGTHGVAPPGP